MTLRKPQTRRRLKDHLRHLSLGVALLVGGCQSLQPAPLAESASPPPASPTTIQPVAYQSDEAAAPAEVPQAAETLQAPVSRASLNIADRPVLPGHRLRAMHNNMACPPMAPAALPAAPCPAAEPFVWAPDEYICDGGDANLAAAVTRDRQVAGLDQEDTVAHYDTKDGHTCVEPSNRVCLYAPRFAAVRKVTGLVQHEQHEGSAGVVRPVGPVENGTRELATSVLQPVQPRGQQSLKFGQTFRERTRGVGMENAQALAVAANELLPYEDFQALRRGQLDNTQKARLAALLQAAVVWSHDQAVQVVIDNVQAVEMSKDVAAESVHTYEMPPGKSRLCLAKCASTAAAQPGDIVQFTLRFENAGEQLIKNVTILDNLSSRLELVPDSQQCSLPAQFSTTANEGESLILKWVIQQPLEVGEGGVIHFQCRVR